jgi:hypothetical protein
LHLRSRVAALFLGDLEEDIEGIGTEPSVGNRKEETGKKS